MKELSLSERISLILNALLGIVAEGHPGPEDMTCVVCGCTEEAACPEGCTWVAADICSACVYSTLEDLNKLRDQPNPTSMQMIEGWLTMFGYDGVYSDDCGCSIEDLRPCVDSIIGCQAGYLQPCTCGEGCDFHIGSVPDGEEEAHCELST